MIDLINGDSFYELDKLEENSIDSCVTDPPYGLTSIVKRFGKEGSAPARFGKDGRFSRLSKGFMNELWDGSGIERNPEFWKKVYRVLKPGGYLLSFGGTRTFHRIAVAIEDAGFEVRDSIAWIYGQGFPKSYQIAEGIGTNLKPAIEPIILARKPLDGTHKENFEKWGTGGLNIDKSRVEINNETVPINKLEKWSGFGQEKRPDYKQEINIKGRWPSNVILDEEISGLLKDYSRFFYVAKASRKEKELGAHPTMKPIKLMEYLIILVTPENGIVLDPFMGSGSTGVACKNLGFNFIGIESNKDYFELAYKRIYAHD